MKYHSAQRRDYCAHHAVGSRSTFFPSVVFAASQLEVLREKHRSAQRRYRERLKAKHEEADQRVELLTRELNQLKTAQVPFTLIGTAFKLHFKPVLRGGPA